MKSDERETRFWGNRVAARIVKKFPKEKIYSVASGISPSGKVHFGNMRDIITSYVVHDALKRAGKNSRCIFSWDEFDRFRKVPANVPKNFEEHIGKPLTAVPDPEKCHESYAKHFESAFEEATQRMGLDIEYLYQGTQYSQGYYDEHIIFALNKRKEIAEILYSFMSEKGKAQKNIDRDSYVDGFYPVRVYSRFSEKDTTEVLAFDGEKNITYKCHDTGKEDTIDITEEHRVKLLWKTDWAMRWKYENVVFEPGGPDHAAPGSSFLVSSAISEKIFNHRPPEFIEYKFVGLQGQGSKMSGSKGNAITPLELLEIYQPSLLKWMYIRKNPNQSFSVALNTEIYRQYDEFDRAVLAKMNKKFSESEAIQLAISFDGTQDTEFERPLPIRQAVALGQIVQWDADKVKEILLALDLQYDIESIDIRLRFAKTWLEKYNPEEMIVLRDAPNKAYWDTMSDEAKSYVQLLKAKIEAGTSGIKELEKLVYTIPKKDLLSQKENIPLQRAFFKDIYNLLIGKDTGPRLSTFLWALDKKRILKLLAM